jgi:hypothetical protein
MNAATTDPLLRRNPGADLVPIRDACARYGSADLLEELIREV